MKVKQHTSNQCSFQACRVSKFIMEARLVLQSADNNNKSILSNSDMFVEVNQFGQASLQN